MNFILKIAIKKAVAKFVQALIAQLPFLTGLLDKIGIHTTITIDQAILVSVIIAGIEFARNWIKHRK